MMTEQDIVRLIEAFAKAIGREISTAARKAAGSGDAVDRFNAGGGLTLRRANAIVQRCSDLWPEEADASWPAEIERPTRKVAA